MPSLKYLVNRIKGMNYKKMLDCVSKVSQVSKKPKLYIFCDMVVCGIKYGAGYVDYDTIQFWNLNSNQRKTMLTRGRNDAIVKKYNDKDYMHYFDRKSEFNKKFEKYLGRSWISPVRDNKDEVLKWLSDKIWFIAKPEDGCCGKGILKINTDDFKRSLVDGEIYEEKIYNYLVDNNIGLLEELIIQSEEMNKIYPDAINTIRVVTFLRDDGKPVIVAAVMRIGTGGRHVDNFNSNGIVLMVDIDTGKTKYLGTNKKGETFSNHPDTGAKITDIDIPRWDKIKEMVLKAALVIPEVRYVGWDVGVAKDGLVFVEGNPYPGHDVYQMAQFIPDKIGVLPRFKKIMY